MLAADSGGVGGSSSKTKKTVSDSVVQDVIAGKYGNGTERQKALADAGYDYKEVNAAVNSALGSGSGSSGTKNGGTSGGGGGGSSSTLSGSAANVSIGNGSTSDLAEQVQQQQAAYDNLIAYQQEMYNESKKQAEANKEQSNRNAYIARELAIKNLPDQLAAQGINGGLAESSMVRLHNNYARALADNDLQYNDTVRQAYQEMLANKANIDANRPVSGSSGTTESTGTETGGTGSTVTSSTGGYLPVTDAIVRDVIAGKYGNGTERQRLLTEAGYDYKAVNAAVTAALSGSSGSSGTGNQTNQVSLSRNTGSTLGMSNAAKAFVATNLATNSSALSRSINTAYQNGMLSDEDLDDLIEYYGLD